MGSSEESLTASSIEESKRRSPIRKAALLPFVFVMYAYATGGPFGLEGHGDDQRAGADAALPVVHPVFSGAFRCRWWRRS